MKTCRKCQAQFEGRFCRECNRARAREWAAANRERSRQSAREWALKNPERKRATDAAYRAANADRIDAYHAQWRQDAKIQRQGSAPRYCERCAEAIPFERRSDARFCTDLCQKRSEINRATHRRRGRMAGGFVEDVHPLVLLERDDGACGICGTDVDPLRFHIDHVIPLARGGEHSYANTQVAHPSCNHKKSAHLQHELEAA